MIKVSRGCLGEEELAEVKEAFDYGYFGLAAKVLEFEEQLGKYLGAPQVVATNTGTSALHLALDALGIGEGDEVIVPSLTFVGSFQAISATGATPVPSDIYPDTLLMDIDDVRRKITARTKAVMPVHYAGNPCNMDALMEIGKGQNIRIVEDAAHALGSCYQGKKIGSFGDITCFSFDSIKNITCGEGGAIIGHDDGLTELLRQKRLLGIDRKSHTSSWKERRWFYQVKTQGFRYHMSNINAAIGLAQLKKIDLFISRRRDICRRYDSAFKEIPTISCLRINYDEVAPHIYVIRVINGRRDGLMEYLKSLDIETSINYIPNHLHPRYADKAVSLPETEKAYEEILTLPLHFGLSDDDVAEVIQGVTEGLKEHSSG
jgi:dTDP-4-amino-4,6-dideoxygalactose transaminase